MSIESPAKKDAATVSENSGGVGTDKKVTSLPLRMRARVLSFYRQSPGIVTAGLIAVLFAAAYLLAPPMGRDLSAQMAHAQLAQQHWPVVLDLRWYGGFDPPGLQRLVSSGDGASGRTRHDGACLCSVRRALRGVAEAHRGGDDQSPGQSLGQSA